MNICLEEVCKCASPDAPDACGCTLAAGAALVSDVPCVVCGAPLTVVSRTLLGIVGRAILAQALATTSRNNVERQAVFSFSAVLAPGETREIRVEVTKIFRAERLVLEMPPRQSRARRFLAYLKHVPWALATTVGVLMRKATDRDARLYWTWPSWRAPRPGPPVQVVNVRTGAAEQFVRKMTPLPSEIFTAETAQSPYLGMQTALAGQELTLVVRSVARKPYELRGCFTGVSIS